MLIEIDDERLQLIRDFRASEELHIKEGSHKQSYETGLIARNLAANAVFNELDKIDEANKEQG